MVNIKEIIDVLQRDLQKQGIHYLSKVKRVNNNLMVTCPYHGGGREHSPSCGILLKDRGTSSKVYKAGTVHCFACGETHTLEEMISHVYGKNDRGHYGREWLLEHFQILSTEEIVFDFEFSIEPLKVSEVEYKSFKQYHPYYASRGVSQKIVEAFDLGFDEGTRSITLPLFDKSGKCIMVIRRALDEHVYMNTSGANKTSSLFGIQMVYKLLPKLIDEPYLFIVEGPFDVLKMWQHGYPAVGIMQAAVSQTQIALIERMPFNNIVIATDNDVAGRDVVPKLANALGKTKHIYVMKYPSGVKDPGDMTKEQLKEIQIVEYKYGKKA